MVQVDAWYFLFHFGNFLTDLGIAFFAIKVSYWDVKRDKLDKKINFLVFLNYNLLRERLDLKIEDDISFNGLPTHLSSNEILDIFGGSFSLEYESSSDIISVLSRNKDKINKIIETTQEKIKSMEMNIIFSNSYYIIVLLLSLGILIQVSSLIYAIYSSKITI